MTGLISLNGEGHAFKKPLFFSINDETGRNRQNGGADKLGRRTAERIVRRTVLNFKSKAPAVPSGVSCSKKGVYNFMADLREIPPGNSHLVCYPQPVLPFI